jgi:hypothetical protein
VIEVATDDIARLPHHRRAAKLGREAVIGSAQHCALNHAGVFDALRDLAVLLRLHLGHRAHEFHPLPTPEKRPSRVTLNPSTSAFSPASTVIGVRDEQGKLGTYSHRAPQTTTITGKSDREYYDYSTERGQLELDSHPHVRPARDLYHQLMSDILPNELQAPLPGNLVAAQNLAQARYLEYVQLINSGGDFELPFRIGDI